MTLSKDVRHTIVSHTANMSQLERTLRLKSLLRVYSITDQGDRKEAARIAAVPEELV